MASSDRTDPVPSPAPGDDHRPAGPALGTLGALGRMMWQATRWKAIRGGWLIDHLLHHRPFEPGKLPTQAPIDILVAIVDHFEPGEREGYESSAAEVASWCEDYRLIAGRHRDSDGRPPQHTWFHRFEYLNPHCIRVLSDEAFRGYGEVEFHLHHAFDTHETFGQKLRAGLDLGNRFGAMLTAEEEPRRRFAYIAGNWSLDNGARDPRTSGCDTELIALRESGCYADFTFPAVGSRAQPRKTNAIYYATDGPEPKSYDDGVDVEVGGTQAGDLMIVQGPLVADWSRGWFEGSDLETDTPPSPDRLDAWLRANVHVRGRPEWIFVKLHTHGMQSRGRFLGPGLDAMFDAMEARWNRPPFRLHYVTAREMYNIVKAAEAGRAGNPDAYRDFDVARPANRLIRCDSPWALETYRPDRVALEVLDPGPSSIEFASGPLRLVRGEIRRLSARFRDDQVHDLQLAGEGRIEVVPASGPPRSVPPLAKLSRA